MQIRSEYYHNFYAFAFNHHTSIQVVMKEGMIYLENTNIALFAWGNGDETTKHRKRQAIYMGIQNENQKYSQTGVTRWFSIPGRKNHPLRIFLD